MTLSFDTSVVVDLIRRREAIRDRFRRCLAGGEPLVISAVALDELRFGAGISHDPRREVQRLDEALASFVVEPLTATDARKIAEYRVTAERRGRRLSAYDGLIAGHAYARGWTLVTSDQKMIDNTIDIAVENWREPA